MRIIVGENVEVVRSSMISRNRLIVDTGSGRVWQIDPAFSGRGLHASIAVESSCDVMNVLPLSNKSLHLVQYSIYESEPYEEEIERLKEEIAQLKRVTEAAS